MSPYTVIAACHVIDLPEDVAIHTFRYGGQLARDEVEDTIRFAFVEAHVADEVPAPAPDQVVIRDYMILVGDVKQAFLPE